MKYAVLIEKSQEHQETWHFYIPIEGNKKALATLKTCLSNSRDAGIWLSEEESEDKTVAIMLTLPSGNQILPSHILLSGKLNHKKIKEASDLMSMLVNGGIRSFMSKR